MRALDNSVHAARSTDAGLGSEPFKQRKQNEKF